MAMRNYDHLLSEMQTQNQAIELMSEVVQALHNREMEMETKVTNAVDMIGGYKVLHFLIPYLDSEKPGFKEYFKSTADLATLIEYAEGVGENDISFDRAALIPDLSPAKRKYKRMVINLIATFKKKDQEVLMNIPRKILAALKYADKPKTDGGMVKL